MVMGVAAIFGMFAGTYYWYPKMFGRMLNETIGKIHFWLTFVGVYLIFMPMHFLGLAGNVRRYSAFTDDYLIRLIPLHRFMTISALATGAVQFLFLFNLFWSFWKGKKASDNPWEATSLEWTVPSPPPFDNFAGKHPVVYHGPNEYGVAGDKDYIMQDSPETVSSLN
jgi:cytochrome c oxidase subunit 1